MIYERSYMNINLGDEAKDKISGFTGVVTGRTDWLNGCTRFMLTPQKLDKDGKPRESQWFDDVQVVLVKAMGTPKARPAGGPRDAPTRAADPAR